MDAILSDHNILKHSHLHFMKGVIRTSRRLTGKILTLTAVLFPSFPPESGLAANCVS